MAHSQIRHALVSNRDVHLYRYCYIIYNMSTEVVARRRFREPRADRGRTSRTLGCIEYITTRRIGEIPGMGAPAGTVSIIIPTYYRNELLREAVESALEQEYEPVEVVVVDDSGEAHAEPVADEYSEMRYVPLEQNVGENRARDAGLDVATGTYVQFLDDDDLLRSDKLAKQVRRLSERTGVVYSGLRYHERGDVILPDSAVKGDVLEHALKFEMWPPCFTSTLLIDRSVLENVRPLRYHGAGDTTFMIGLARRTEFDFVDEPLVDKRIEVDSLGFSLENVGNKRRLITEYDDLYDQYPQCRAAAKTHVHSQEGHVRLADAPWTPRAITSFARAAYHAPADKTEHVATFLGSVFGRYGVDAVDSCRDLVASFRRSEQVHSSK